MNEQQKEMLEALASYRLNSAKEDLGDAQILFDKGSFKSANNRAYYAIFHAINAVHAIDNRGFKRHKDAIGAFNKTYVKSGSFPREIGRKISEAQEIRQASDYDDFFIAHREETKELIDAAGELIALVETFLN